MDSEINGDNGATPIDSGLQENARYLPVTFFTNQKSVQVPGGSFSVPATSSVTELNSFIKQLAITETDEPRVDFPTFDFLVNGILLRVSLGELIDEIESIDAESDIKIECVLKTEPPEPQFDVVCEDWVAAAVQTEQIIIAGCYDSGVRIISAISQPSNKKSAVLELNQSQHNDAIKCVATLPSAEEGVTKFVTGSTDMTIAQWRWQASAAIPLTCLGTYRGHERSVECVAANSDGDRIVSGGFDSMLKVWQEGPPASDGEPSSSVVGGAKRTKNDQFTKRQQSTQTPMVTLGGHREAVTGVAWPHCNKATVATCSFDHSIIVWDLELAGQTSRLVGERSHTSLAACQESPNVLITGSTDRHVRLWDTRSTEGSLVKGTFSSHLGWVSDVRWCPQSENLFASASYDKLVKIWDRRSHKAPLYDLKGHEDKVLSVDWNFNRIVSGGADGAVKVFAWRNPTENGDKL